MYNSTESIVDCGIQIARGVQYGPSKYCLRSKYLWQCPKFEMPDGRGAYDNNGVMMHPESAFPSVVWIGKQTWHHILIGLNTFLGLFVGLVNTLVCRHL